MTIIVFRDIKMNLIIYVKNRFKVSLHSFKTSCNFSGLVRKVFNNDIEH